MPRLSSPAAGASGKGARPAAGGGSRRAWRLGNGDGGGDAWGDSARITGGGLGAGIGSGSVADTAYGIDRDTGRGTGVGIDSGYDANSAYCTDGDTSSGPDVGTAYGTDGDIGAGTDADSDADCDTDTGTEPNLQNPAWGTRCRGSSRAAGRPYGRPPDYAARDETAACRRIGGGDDRSAGAGAT